MNHADYGYGLWSLVIMNSLVFIIFAFSFTKPRSKKIGVLLECFQPLWLHYLRKCMDFH
jgi:hypothetical protein